MIGKYIEAEMNTAYIHLEITFQLKKKLKKSTHFSKIVKYF